MTSKTPTSPDLNPDDIRVGATIREMRIMRGMTQDEFSREATLSRPYLANIEAGRKRPSMRAVARIAAALRVPQVAILPPVEAPESGAVAS